jgi:Mn2+/Fe2+ NRAMP family transporter
MDDKHVTNSPKTADLRRTGKKILIRVILALVIVGLAFFVEAGTWKYWEAWVYIITLFIPVCGVIVYFLKKDPEVMERHMRPKEKETTQKWIVSLIGIPLAAGFLLPGFDRRFG